MIPRPEPGKSPLHVVGRPSSVVRRQPSLALKVIGLGKRYRIGAPIKAPATRLHTAGRALASPFRYLASALRPASEEETLWALKDISFEVKRGEVVGVIGRNGAGKSTLLKILSRITEPTEGVADIYGRVGSLLEVGTGFHPELTGRENTYLNGTILGMRKREIDAKFDEIVDFSGVEKFIDTPVKRYSSGMYVRLAFAVAAHLETEILLVDEVLAVGDVGFQKKCLGKMDDVAKAGRTVLFVSHNMAAIQQLCDRCVILKDARDVFAGTTEETIGHYLQDVSADGSALGDAKAHRGSGQAHVSNISIRDRNDMPLENVMSGQDIRICLDYERDADLTHTNIVASIAVRTQLGAPVFLQHNRLKRQEFGMLPQKGTMICEIDRLPLPAGRYVIDYSLIADGVTFDGVSSARTLDVIEGDFFGSGEVPPASHGLCLVDANWRIKRDGPSARKEGV